MTEPNPTNQYNKEENESVDIRLTDLNHTGSWDDKENQVAVLETSNSDTAKDLRRTFRQEDPDGIKDFEFERPSGGEDTYKLYFAGSYGARSLLASVGSVLYNSEEFGE